jgi:DNA mismatch repair protein MutS2
LKQHSLDVLEFNKIKNQIREYAETTLGKELIDKLYPVAELDYVQNSLEEVRVAKELIIEYRQPSFGGIRDLREIFKKKDRGIVLSINEIIMIRDSIYGFKNIKGYFNEITINDNEGINNERFGIILGKGKDLILLPEIAREIDRCIDEYGEIKDRASKKLFSLRSEMKQVENRIRDRLESIIRGGKYLNKLQDTLITRRGDRYVVPVKHEYRNEFPGIVHDQSASGLTFFMEPIAVVKLNNRLREIKAEEEREIYLILQGLSSKIEEKIDIIELNLDIVQDLDLIFAKAGYSIDINGIAPEINNSGKLIINEGRHPLLKEKAVPISVFVGDNFSTLIITGPNTGGKTVALKVIGLFVIMIESGIHIPAKEKSNICLFKDIFADIGDEQSIEQNLSTFSSHINRINTFLSEADNNSLVLLDELGVGTDPKEGAALGIAILEKLKEKNVVTVATTHYGEIKTYAYSQEGVENASVEFDMETLQPTYKLLMSVPGGSNAFEIALKLGFPEDIIMNAKNFLSDKRLKVEEIITDLNREHKKYRELKERFLKQEKDSRELKKMYEDLINKLKREEKELIEKGYDKVETIINKTRKESREIIKDLKSKEFTSRSDIDRALNEVNQKIKVMERTYIKEEEEGKENKIDNDIESGDKIKIRDTGKIGQVLEIDYNKGKAKVQVGIIKIEVNIADLLKVNDYPDKEEPVQRYSVEKSNRVFSSLDLRGERYENAKQRLDKYIDDVFLAGLKEVEIIHGKGNGILREAVKEALKLNPHISSFRLGRQEEGGSGVTIVSMDN